MKQTILTQITARMTEKKISRAELAKAVGVVRNTLWRNLKGENEMTLETFLKICEVLELEIIIK
ncbi:MAG: helix-turn-helix domain-containing protein [Flavobacteriales bacterium]|nr:helix-turn-helix domain-containing protein [Flavobacteriales bacterium]